MYLKDRQSGDLVEVLDVGAAANPCENKIAGRFHSGEELQPPAYFDKANLSFPSGEALPTCWTNPHYRQ
ncbi:MAG: acetyltransferase [Gammaproteobacteria bacterium]|nr:acetyltransferase [Gammaproteobacteria bacterium]